MGHRRMLNTPQILETHDDQGQNHAAQPYMPIAGVGASESSSVHPVEDTTIQGGPFPSPWIPAPSSSGYSSSILNAEWPHHQPEVPGPSSDPFLHQPADGRFNTAPHNYSHHPSLSSLGGQTVPGIDGRFYNQTMGSGRGPYKRKTPSIRQLCDKVSTSRYYDVGSSSNRHLPADPQQETQNTESYRTPWVYPPGYRVNNLYIGGEGVERNVRSRVEVDLEPIARTHLSINSLHNSFSAGSSNQSSLVDFWGQGSSNAPTWEQSRSFVSPAGHRVTFAGPSFLRHDPNAMNAPNSYASGSVESGGYTNNATSNRSPVSQNANSNFNQSVSRWVLNGYGQRSFPAFRAWSSNFHPGRVAASDEGLRMAAESYPSRHPRGFSTIRLNNIRRNCRTGIASDTYSSFTEDASFRAQLTPEGVMVVDRSILYGSRILFDQHRDMRLDTDNMSYEELLMLGERIGSVSTGLSDSLISKCLTESIYCSSGQSQNDGTCVICLEEYKNMDDVGTLKCGHDFHVGCIRKWLSMKNLCPICKGAAMDDSTKEKCST